MKNGTLRSILFIGILGASILFSFSCSKKAEEAGSPSAPAAKVCGPAAQAQAAEKPQAIKTPGGFEMVLIPGGTFTMGDASIPDAPPHKVTVSPFYMDTHEVTQAMYEDLIGNNPAKFDQDDKNPIEQVRWTQAVRYCNARSENEKLKPCYNEDPWACDFSANGYRLPTEAEWEYACRAGTATKYWFGDDPQPLGASAWFKGNSAQKTHPVGGKPANPWGLFDIHGNVFEWCNDWYAADYYKTSPEKDPRGPEKGEKRLLRGGAWSSAPEKCTSAYRYSDMPTNPDSCLGYDYYGFRCAKSASEKEAK